MLNSKRETEGCHSCTGNFL